MHGMHLSSKEKLFEIGASRFETKTASILATVINADVAKINASF